jgi:hypothetical protein
MPGNIIGKDAPKSPALSTSLQQVTFNSIRKILPDRAIDQACRDVGYRFRKRTLTPVVTVLHMILAAIWPEESFQASAQLIWDNFAGAFARLSAKQPGSGSLAKARARLPLALWDRIGQFLATNLQELSEPFAAWRGHRVILVDGTCVSMPDTPELHKHFGTSAGRGGKRRYPLGRMVSLALGNTMAVLAYALGRYRDSEQSLLRPLLAGLRQGDLLVADRHFAGANLYAEYLAAGLHFLTRAHQALNISRLRRLEGYGPNDFVADLPIGQACRRKDPTMPGTVRVRLIQAAVRTRGRREVMWFVTSLLEDAIYPAWEIVELYGRRWRIETLFLQLKRGLSADVLRSKTAAGVRKELAACVAALNVVRAVMLEAAMAHEVDPMRLSFVGAVRAVLAFAPVLAASPVWKLPVIYEVMLREIAMCRVVPRPGRQEPRAVTREWKHYPKLKTTRAEWRNRWAA